MVELRRVCVFCGSAPGLDPDHMALAQEMGSHLAAAGIGLVYGGGNIGLMGALASAVMDGGGDVIGVIPTSLLDREREIGHAEITELREVADMHERKATMYSLADAFAVLPGGLGTLEELFESATWNQLGLHDRVKPIAIVDRTGLWEPLRTLLDAIVDQRFMKPTWRGLIGHADSPAAAIDWLRSAET